MSKAVITSLAMLKVNWDRYQKSYTDNFVPLAAECIRKSGQPVVSLADLQARMLGEFGLRIPAHSLRVVLERLKKQGYVRQEHKVYLPIVDKLRGLSIEETRRQVEEQHVATVKNLVEFCCKKYGVTWSEQEAEIALTSYLKDHDLDILAAATEGTPIPAIGKSVRNAKFLVNSFIRQITKNDPVAFSYLETVVKGHLLANALVFPDVAEVTRKFHCTKVFFDTRLILNALGYGGVHHQAACKDLLQLLYEEGAEFRCFRHTYDEIYGILDATARSYRGKNAQDFPVGLALAFPSSTESDVLLAMSTLEKDIERLRIKIEEKPSYIPAHMISEADLDKHLQEKIGYFNDRARVRDVDSLSAIYRLRKGDGYVHIEECKALFVTTNTLLVRASADFFQAFQTLSAAPHCISDHHLTNILWLKKPMVIPDLPRKKIIADSYAAMEPSADLWRRFLAEVDKLKARGDISAEQYLLLRSSLEVRALLMDATQGDPDVIVEGTVSEVLDAYNASLKAEAETKRKEAQVRADKLASNLLRIGERIEGVANRIASVVGRAIFFAIVGMLVMGSYYSYASGSLPKWLRYSFSATALLLALAGLANLVLGISVKVFVRRMESTIRRFVLRKLEQVFLSP